MINEKLNLPFDLYTRNKIISDLIESIREKNKSFKILDVGGRSGYLKEFIKEEDELFILDIRNSELKEKNYFIGSITSAPFKDGFFDLVVSSDFYEHLSPNSRLTALSEMLRLTKNFIILVAPFYSEEVYDAEIKANEFYHKLTDIEHMWLAEHITNGLPKRDELEKFLKENSCKFYSIENNNILNWLLMQSFIFYTHTNPMPGVNIEEVFRFYNENFLELGDSLPPTYRKVYFISKGRTLPKVSLYEKSKNNRINILKYEQLLSLTFMNIGEKVKEREKQFNDQIKQLNIHINQLNLQIKSLDSQIDSIFKSITWRAVMKYDELIGKRLRFIRNRLHSLIKISNYYNPLLMGLIVIRNEGLGAFFYKLKARWGWNKVHVTLKYNAPSKEELEKYKEELKTFNYNPKISIITPVYNVDEKWLRLCLDSVLNQVYENWELCIADDASTKGHIKKILEEYSKKDTRIKVKYLDKNLGISGASNEALSLATGDFINLLDNDDEIPPDAFYELVRLLNKNRDLDMIYADEDKIDTKSHHYDPFFKPDWSPDLLFSFMYIGHSTYRKQLVMDVGGFRSKYDFSQDYDLALRITEKTNNIGHIEKILYHWRSLPSSAASGGKDFARASNIGALQSAIERRGYNAEAIVYPYANRLKFILKDYPLISIIIPTDDKNNLFSCVNSILQKTDYSNYEIVIVTNSKLGTIALEHYNNEKRVCVDEFDKPFNFSAKCNSGARKAKGDYFLFLNDDMEVLDRDWMENMIEIFGRKEVGAVSPKLIYENNTIQHAGLVTSVRGLVGTAFHTKHRNSTDYFNLIQSTRDASALSAACILVPRNIYESIRGFDEANTPIMHSDFDLCFRIREKGYLLVYTPFTTLKHVGHVSIGKVEKENKPRPKDNVDLYLIKRFPKFMSYDSYYTEKMRDLLYEDAFYKFKLIADKTYETTNGSTEKNIAFISHELSLTGAPIIIYNLATYLVGKGYFITIISPQEGELITKYKEAGIPVIIDASILENPSSGSQKFLANFDLVVANTILSWRVVHLSKEIGIRAIWFIQETEFGKQLSYSDKNVSKAFEVADSVMFLTHAQANMYKDFIKDKFQVIYPGIQNPDLQNDLKHEEGKFRILHVGSIEPRKGQDILVKGILSLPKKYSDIFEFYMVGRFLDKDYQTQLEKSIKSLNNVHLIGQVKHEDLGKYYKMADVFVCTSRDEALGLVIPEAMSYSKAIISSNVGGIPEIIDDKINGILIQNEDHTALISNLIRLYEDKIFRSMLEENAYKKYNENFTLEKYGDRFLKVMQDF